MSEWDRNSSASGWGVPPAKAENVGGSAAGDTREWKLIEKLLMSMQGEQRKTRRWGIFFKSLTFLYLFGILYLATASFDGAAPEVVGDHVAVVDVYGVIADEEEASAENIIDGLRAAFENEEARAVVLRINSPGGSPVQSDFVFMEIMRLREKHPDTPVYAVIGDIGASGAYYIAAAADEIYASRASLVGSIGVVAGGFGFVDAMEKLGVERRLYTAGEHKGFLDPFSPEQPEEVKFWNEVLDNTHALFIERVRQGRGDKLAADASNELFSGLIWTGDQAKNLGLIDGFGSVDSVARDIVGVDEKVDYSRRPSPYEELFSRLGASAGEAMVRTMEQSRLELR
ncbi:MAG: S49 family peptidase [Alteromonadaceae bacterium]|nr:S49 family peptidase [Alteromonadaceae bacterium]